ncbi:MAG: RNA polymerase sigma factor [Coriobacteriales bacterium]|jgi:RNA polymerase sigma-70 factor (ECF subfamily)|nr:RNA polymerase sigma factor [Coriobacteriales bacterium]
MLIRRAIAGDAVAVEQLCQLYAKTILFQTRLLVRNKNEAEDVAQRVAIEMLRGIQHLRSSYAFRSWLQRLIVSACSRQNAQTQRELERAESLEFAEAIVDDSPEARPEEEMVSKDMRRHVDGYLGKLPPAQAVTLTMYYYEQLSYKEIAAALGISVGAVSSTIAKAKKNLKKLLKDSGEQDALGIKFTLPFLRGDVGKAVYDEVNSGVSNDAVERFMVVCKANIFAFFSKAGTAAVAATGIGGTLVAALAAVAVMGGVGALVLLPEEEFSPFESIVTPEQTIVISPDSRVTYSVEGEQLYDDPTNPLTAQIDLLSDEHLDRWVLTDSKGTELLFGSGNYLDIAALELTNGEYTLSWYLHNDNDDKFRAFWKFTIQQVADE